MGFVLLVHQEIVTEELKSELVEDQMFAHGPEGKFDEVPHLIPKYFFKILSLWILILQLLDELLKTDDVALFEFAIVFVVLLDCIVGQMQEFVFFILRCL